MIQRGGRIITSPRVGDHLRPRSLDKGVGFAHSRIDVTCFFHNPPSVEFIQVESQISLVRQGTDWPKLREGRNGNWYFICFIIIRCWQCNRSRSSWCNIPCLSKQCYLEHWFFCFFCGILPSNKPMTYECHQPSLDISSKLALACFKKGKKDQCPPRFLRRRPFLWRCLSTTLPILIPFILHIRRKQSSSFFVRKVVNQASHLPLLSFQS